MSKNDTNHKKCSCNNSNPFVPFSSKPRLPQLCFRPCMEPTESRSRMGPTGPDGKMGPTGPEGKIGPTGPEGKIGPAGPEGKMGPAGPDGKMGPAGPEGKMGPAGSKGEMGPAGPEGRVGSAGPEGKMGPIGPPGSRGPMAATIPFSIANSMYGQGVEIASDEQGKPSIVNFAGFGDSSPSYSVQLQPGDWDAKTITFDSTISYPNCFLMPFDGILQNIYVLFANREALELEEGLTMYPFVCLAISEGKSLVFTIISETITYTEPYIGGETLPKYTLRKGAAKNLNIKISEGTMVGIVIGWRGEGVTPAKVSRASISGGLFLE